METVFPLFLCTSLQIFWPELDLGHLARRIAALVQLPLSP